MVGVWLQTFLQCPGRRLYRGQHHLYGVYGLSLDNRLAKGASFTINRSLPNNSFDNEKSDEDQVDKLF